MKVTAVMQIASFACDYPRAALAMVSWPKFSLTSYRLVSRLVEQGMRPRTVLDVGANVGQFGIAAAKLFPGVHVHSFEPLPTAVAALRRNVRRLDNVTVYPIALGDRDGEVAMRVNVHSHSSSLLPMARAHYEAFPDAREAGEVIVEMTTLDKVVDAIRLEPPILLKVTFRAMRRTPSVGVRRR